VVDADAAYTLPLVWDGTADKDPSPYAPNKNIDKKFEIVNAKWEKCFFAWASARTGAPNEKFHSNWLTSSAGTGRPPAVPGAARSARQRDD